MAVRVDPRRFRKAAGWRFKCYVWGGMKLRTIVVLASALTILIFAAIAELFSARQVAEVFTRLETHVRSGVGAEALAASARSAQNSLIWQTAILRLLVMLMSLAALAAVLSLVWARFVDRPISRVVERIRSMSRGTWTQSVKVERHDEIGQLVTEFNLLGPKLTFAAHQYAAASKLAAMALIGQRVNRRAAVARKHLEEIQRLLIEARLGDQVVPQCALSRIERVADELADMAADLESEFNDELVHQGLAVNELHLGEGGSVLAGRQDPQRPALQPGPAGVRHSPVGLDRRSSGSSYGPEGMRYEFAARAGAREAGPEPARETRSLSVAPLGCATKVCPAQPLR